MAFRMTELVQKVRRRIRNVFQSPPRGRCLFHQIQGWPERPVAVSFLSLRLQKRALVTPLSMPLNMKRKAHRIVLLCMYTLHKSYSLKIFPSISDLRFQRIHCSHIETHIHISISRSPTSNSYLSGLAPLPHLRTLAEKRWVGMPVEIQDNGLKSS